LVGKYEVTQAEYRKVMAANPSKSVNARQPVEQVSWNDANEFCSKLTEMERGKLPPANRYALPTEKQWEEFAGGQKFKDIDSPGGVLTRKGQPSEVGQPATSNRFGLFDVLGNVWEWCLDEASENKKVIKGGAFDSADYRRTLRPEARDPNCGFRCILAAP
jgi:formylglycine-generating enzyme required for sulfatase activity